MTIVETKPTLPLVERIDVSDGWAINTYATCDIKCTYCITGAQGRSIPRRSRDEVAEVLHRELDALPVIERVLVGVFCDAYPNVEKDLRISQRALEALNERDQGFNLISKSPLVVRDLDLCRHKDTVIQVSLATLNDDWIAKYEPGAAPSKERLDALHKIAESGVSTWVLAAPYVPGVTDLRELRDAIDPNILIYSYPLRIDAFMRGNYRSMGFDQASVNKAYEAHFDEIGPLPKLRWAKPPPLSGEAQHVRDIMGKYDRKDWTPANAAENQPDYKEQKGHKKRFLKSQSKSMLEKTKKNLS